MKSVLNKARGTFAIIALVIITLLGFIPLLPTALLKLLIPINFIRRPMTQAVVWVASTWAHGCTTAIRLISGVEVTCYQKAPTFPNGRVLIMANHQSWADIFILLTATYKKYPFTRFFIKDQLRWLPVVGLACWALDFPFMKRYSREKIKKNPALRNKDIQTIEKSCAKFRDWPVTIINYVEGTRSNARKRAAAKSPFQTLLPPKTGGVALACHAMGDILDGVLDASIGYINTPEPTFWKFLCGEIPEVTVQIRQLRPPVDLSQPAEYNPAYRKQFKPWLNEIWAEKDADITAIQDPTQPQDSFYSPLFRDERKEIL